MPPRCSIDVFARGGGGDGAFRRAIGVRGDGPCELNNPRGIALGTTDGSSAGDGGKGGGVIFVADQYNDRVQVFARGRDDGTWTWRRSVTCTCAAAAGVEFLVHGVAIDRTRDELWTAEPSHGMLRVFRASTGERLRTHHMQC